MYLNGEFGIMLKELNVQISMQENSKSSAIAHRWQNKWFRSALLSVYYLICILLSI